MQYIDKRSRDIDVVTLREHKNHILSKYLLDKELLLRMEPFDQKVTLKKILDDGENILIYLPPETDVFLPMNIQLFKVLANYIHVDCDFIQQVDPTLVLLHVNKLEIAKRNRENERYPLEPGVAYATNIISSKFLIETDMLNIPNLIRVNFEDYKNKFTQRINEKVQIDIFRSDLDFRYDIIKKTQKYLWIEDTQNPNSYKPKSSDQINYAEEIDDDIKQTIQKYKETKIVSELILPILYTNHFEEQISVGYVSIQSKENKISHSIVEEFKKLRVEIANRIRESNIIKTTERFQILEASRHGLKMRITNPILIETLQKHDKFVFDIYFKMQAPFTVSAEIRWISMDEDRKKLDLGVELIAKSALAGEREQYYKNLDLARKGHI